MCWALVLLGPSLVSQSFSLPISHAISSYDEPEFLGTAAAAWQASIGGSVAAGSLFAGVQSVAMGAALPAAVTYVGAGVGGLGGAAVGTTTVGATVVDTVASGISSGIGAAAGGLHANANVSPDI